MDMSKWAPLRHTAKLIGFIGIAASLTSWVLLVLLYSLWLKTTLWVGSDLVVWLLGSGVPMTGGVMAAFWIGVVVWTHHQTTHSPKEINSDNDSDTI